MTPDNDNMPSRRRPTSFRDKVLEHYLKTNVLPDSAAFITTYYMSAMMRQTSPDMDVGPVLAGCEKFGPEASPRSIVQKHVERTMPSADALEAAHMVERALLSARVEIGCRNTDIHGKRHKAIRGFC